MLELDKDKKVLIGCLASSFIFYHTARQIYSYVSAKSREWVPIGIVKGLHIYPIKSCKPVDVFAFKCTKLGPMMEELEDRVFVLVEESTGKFITARQKPKLVNVESYMTDGILEISVPGHPKLSVDLKKVVENGRTIRATLFDNLQQDGYDCGDEVAKLLSDYIEEPNYRLLFSKEGLYTERTCIPDDQWWNTPVPKRKDNSGFTDLAPFLIATEASLKAVNEKLDKKVTMRNFRPSIYIEGCAAWDEDKWAEIRIGEAHLECFAPCTRCVLTTVDPEKGEMSKEMQPLKKLREFRLAPEGKMSKAHKDSPVFGVYAGTVNEAYIHIGQTAYVKYKPTVF
ncbi:MOSC domain-containing protein [Caenorhabditis elegans]|uniref:MOSC domain-containing protein n=1 Tax=Caenorhabditis elegans TaxID=6239 RepID=P91321_CAEEL|nr:MOSC domain-containing protein [Caenorhabditis elegans]CCD66097.1 MOSC domain-containing protein [Caenorhabditis elegans]|eukprot:NP_503716.1 Uncharacterized protein CELE_F53E10.1 [Caenorhabditis elegans]